MTLLEQCVSARFKSLGPTFDEKSRRLWAAAEALSAGRGGIARGVAAAQDCESDLRGVRTEYVHAVEAGGDFRYVD